MKGLLIVAVIVAVEDTLLGTTITIECVVFIGAGAAAFFLQSNTIKLENGVYSTLN